MIRGNSWTPEEEAWLREVYPTHHNAEIARMHAEVFPDRPRRTAKAVNSRAKVYGLHKAPEFVRNPPRFWTPEKDEWFRAFVPGHCEAEISAEHERIYGTPLTPSQIGNRKSKLGVQSGTNGGQFRRGRAPANKGKKWSEYGTPEGHERSRATCFKKGEVHDRPDGWLKPLGHERVDAKDGYVYVKVRDSRIHGIQEQRPGNYNSNYRLKHHVIYEQVHGPIPEGCNVVFADHDKRNFDPSNLVAVPRDIWATLSHEGLRYWDAESLRLCMNIVQLDRARYALECRPRPCKRCGETFAPRFAGQRTCDRCLGERRET